MFQKLYKHLEEMNDSLRQDKEHSAGNSQLTAKISAQLEEVNRSILMQNSLLELQKKQIETAQAQNRRGLTPILQVVNLCISCVGIVVIIFFAYYTLQWRRVPLSPSVPVIQTSLPSSADTETARDLQIHLAKLDTLINEQTQSLKELKKLNATSVRAFWNIRRRLDQVDRTTRAALPNTDSLSLAK